MAILFALSKFLRKIIVSRHLSLISVGKPSLSRFSSAFPALPLHSSFFLSSVCTVVCTAAAENGEDSMQGKITKAAIDALKEGQILADTEVKGFVARRLPSGVVTYGLRYRVFSRQRWLALGIHGRITPDKARKLAKQRIGEVAADRDPAGERQAALAKAVAARVNTVNAVLDN